MDWQNIWLQVQPHILEAVSVIVAALIARAALAFTAKTGIEVQARHREALQQAIMSGINMALSKSMAPNLAAEAAVDHAFLSVPDAITALTKSNPKLPKTKREREKAIRDILLRIALGKLGLAGKLLSGG